MPPFHYEAYQNPFVGSIADLIQAPGRAQAQAALTSGQAYGNALANIGTTIGGAVQQATDPRLQLERAQLAQAQQQQGDVKALDAASLPAQGPVQPGQSPALPSRDDILAQLPGHLRAAVQKQFDDADESAARVQKAQIDAADATTQYFGTLASSVRTHAYDPGAALIAIAHARDVFKGNQAMQGELDKVTQQIQANPTPANVQTLIAPFLQQQLVKTTAGETVTDVNSGTIVAGGTPKPKTQAELAVDASDPNSPTQQQSAAALALLKPEKDTASADDARFERIQTAINLKQPVSPPDLAWAKAYQTRKTLGPEASAAAAADRQAATIAQQNGIQQRNEAFTESQAGRKELTEKIEQPYLDAREKADTLRSVVAAAKGGNMEAASVQSLLGTLGLVTTEGVKRINGIELQNVAGAGSLWQKVQAAAGKLTAGQPLPQKLQDDLLQLSNLLEQSARKKYDAGFKATTTRYGLKDEQPLPADDAAATNGPIQVGGFTVKVK